MSRPFGVSASPTISSAAARGRKSARIRVRADCAPFTLRLRPDGQHDAYDQAPDAQPGEREQADVVERPAEARGSGRPHDREHDGPPSEPPGQARGHKDRRSGTQQERGRADRDQEDEDCVVGENVQRL